MAARSLTPGIVVFGRGLSSSGVIPSTVKMWTMFLFWLLDLVVSALCCCLNTALQPILNIVAGHRHQGHSLGDHVQGEGKGDEREERRLHFG